MQRLVAREFGIVLTLVNAHLHRCFSNELVKIRQVLP
jgi:hypothetical protein